MKMKLMATALALVSALGLSAQEKGNPNPWFMSVQGGITYSTGSTGIGKLLSPGGQIAVGKYFSPVWGARLSIGGWQGKAPGMYSGSEDFYYGAATIDGLMNISQLVREYPDRPVDFSLVAGIGVNRAFHGCTSLMGKLGVQAGIRLNDALDLNVEATANGVSDKWNGLDDHGIDSYFNLGVGLTYKFKTGQKCVSCVTVEYPEVLYTEDELNQIVNEQCAQSKTVYQTDTVTVEKIVKEGVQGIRSHVVFELAKTSIQPSQEMNVQAIATYLNNNPEAKASLTGYADKGTGSKEINLRLAKQRAEVVRDCLVNKYGIAADRITTSSMEDVNDQPFQTNDWNRVVIMIAE